MTKSIKNTIKKIMIQKEIKDDDIGEIIETLLKTMKQTHEDILEFCKKIMQDKMAKYRVIIWYMYWKNYGLTTLEIKKIEYYHEKLPMKEKENNNNDTIKRILTKNYKENQRVFQVNPYKIIKLSLETCDRLVERYKIKIKNERIVGTMVRYLTDNIKTKGWTCTPCNIMKLNFVKYINYDELIEELKRDYCIIIQYNCIYFKKQLTEEINAIKLIKSTDIVEKLQYDHNYFAFDKMLNTEQKDAIIMALREKCSIITGGAGTGKSTVIKNLVDILINNNIRFVILGFTGKCLSRLKEIFGEKTDIEILFNGNKIKYNYLSTIHKFIYKNIYRDISPEFIIFEESSMIPLRLVSKLSYLLNGSQFVFIGDKNQLPPIGYGPVFEQLLLSQFLPHKELLISHRCCGDILKNTNEIPFGRPISSGDSFTITTSLKIEQLCNNLEEVTILSPSNAPLAEINKICQKVYNPPSPRIKEILLQIPYKDTIWRVGDRVIMLENNYHFEVMNGEEGIITDVFGDFLLVTFPYNRIVPYYYHISRKSHLSASEKSASTRIDLSSLRHSWAMTVHKSQGSEWNNVIFVVPQWNKESFINRKLIYTALTRCKKQCFVIASPFLLNKFISDPLPPLYSNICNRLLDS